MNRCITAKVFRKRSHSKELACAPTGVRRLWWQVHPATAPKCGSQTSDELAFSGECRIKTGKNSSHSPENTFLEGGFTASMKPKIVQKLHEDGELGSPGEHS